MISGHMLRNMLVGPESYVFDLPSILRGLPFSLNPMWVEVSVLNLQIPSPSLQMRCSSSS